MGKAKLELSATRAQDTASGYRWQLVIKSADDSDGTTETSLTPSQDTTAIASEIFESICNALEAAKVAIAEMRNSIEVKILE